MQKEILKLIVLLEDKISRMERGDFPDNGEMVPKDELYYQLGNAYWKLQDWKKALDSYSQAIKLNPQSPAVQTREMVMSIIGYYYKDVLNP